MQKNMSFVCQWMECRILDSNAEKQNDNTNETKFNRPSAPIPLSLSRPCVEEATKHPGGGEHGTTTTSE